MERDHRRSLPTPFGQISDLIGVVDRVENDVENLEHALERALIFFATSVSLWIKRGFEFELIIFFCWIMDGYSNYFRFVESRI